MFCHNHEAITTPSLIPGQAALRESGCSSPEGTARAEFFCAFHDTTTLLNDDAVWLSLLQVLGVGASPQDTWQFQTFFPCVSASNPRLDGGAALGLGCCAATAQRGHHCCKSECCKRSLQDMIVCAFSTGDGSVPPGGTVAAALGLLLWAPFTAEGSKTHATFSPSLRCVFVLCLLASRCSGFFLAEFPVCCLLLVVPLQGNDTFGDSLLECAHCPSREVHFACRCAAQVFF